MFLNISLMNSKQQDRWAREELNRERRIIFSTLL